jgi:molybdate-binding protein
VTIVNREAGSGARLLLDQQLAAEGVPYDRVKGYDRTASSHFHVARLVAEGQADVGIGVRAAANQYGLAFIPIRPARYDLVVPKDILSTHPSLSNLFDAIVGRQFRAEVEALGGYDTTETGTIRNLRV